eukprot:scaffold501489_cov33-Prasinocladus_malaysianus.AAC.1
MASLLVGKGVTLAIIVCKYLSKSSFYRIDRQQQRSRYRSRHSHVRSTSRNSCPHPFGGHQRVPNY